MSRKTLVYLAALIGIVCSGLVVAHFTRATAAVEIQPVYLSHEKGTNPPLMSQVGRERLWRPLLLQKILVIDDIKQPMDIKDDAEGNTFIFDWSDFKIKKFSTEGKLIQTIGKGNGSERGQFVNPTGFDVSKDGQIWVCDPKGVVTVFDQGGEVIRTLSTKNPAMRIVHGNDHSFVTMASPRAALLWETYTDSGEFRKAFGELIEDQSGNALSLMGWIAGDGSDTFYYAAQYPGIIASYKMSGEPRFFVRAIDPRPLPKIEITIKGIKKLQYHDAEVSAFCMSVAGDAIYVLTEVVIGGNKRKVVDVYSKEAGSYSYSSEVPESSDRIFFTEGFVYTVGRATVTKWQTQM